MILVTGGSGLVGSHLKEVMPDAIYLSSKDFDLNNMNEVDEMMNLYRPHTVIHLAARCGNLFDNMNYPLDYIESNVLMAVNVFKKCHEYNVEKVVTCLSSCIYPEQVNEYPMKEEILFKGPPPIGNFSYGIAKRCIATLIDSYVTQYNKKWFYLIPCNLYGEHDKYGDHNSHFVAALIKKIYNSDKILDVWGTGKPFRQFIHAEDLAKVIKILLEKDICDNFNVTTPYSFTIKKIAEIALRATGKDLEIKFDETKPDGQFRKDTSPNKLLKEIDFEFMTLEKGIKRVYDNFSKRHDR